MLKVKNTQGSLKAGERSLSRRPVGVPDLVAKELQSEVRWTLAREANAAKTIQKLTRRIDANSELAQKARTYASTLVQYIARIEALLPRDPTWVDCTPEHDILTDSVIQSLNREKAMLVLARFLAQHAEATSDTLALAADRLNFKSIHRLWQKASKERGKLLDWLAKQETLLIEGETPEDDASTAHASSDHCAKTAKFACGDHSQRISYHPPQLVIWM